MYKKLSLEREIVHALSRKIRAAFSLRFQSERFAQRTLLRITQPFAWPSSSMLHPDSPSPPRAMNTTGFSAFAVRNSTTFVNNDGKRCVNGKRSLCTNSPQQLLREKFYFFILKRTKKAWKPYGKKTSDDHAVSRRLHIRIRRMHVCNTVFVKAVSKALK